MTKNWIQQIAKASALASVFLLFSFSEPVNRPAEDVEEELFEITIKVKNLRNSTGILQYSIYDKDGTIPDEHFKKHYYQKKAKIVNGSSTMTFYKMPKGKYAVNILHDENKNGKIDKGWVLPIEGIGFSNFSSFGLMNRPNFKKASFYVDKDVTKTVKIIYM